MEREYLKAGTFVRLPGGECYQIHGGIGEGGGSLLYSAVRLTKRDGRYVSEGGIRYALKECFPFSRQFAFTRLPSGEVCPEKPSQEAEGYLRQVASMQLNEGKITSDIYATEAIRMVPIQQVAGGVELSFDGGESFAYVANTFTVMASLENKGESVAAWYKKTGKLPAMGSFTVIREVLLALREVHRAGYLHLDLQEGNVFVAGDWKDQSIGCFLIDFGSARKLLEDGRCAENGGQPVFSSGGYRAPELAGILTGEGRDFRLGPEADLYSVGYLLLFLLTGRHYGEETLAKFRTEYGSRYLTRKNLQELKVPAYVEELMQHVLSAALEERPEKRYQNVDEMLGDVDKLTEALAPYRPRLSGLTYDAYILYRAENALHKMAAETLQRCLEHFRTPGIKRIKRVFLDSTELSADHDADKQLAEALKDSDYLIVIGEDSQEDPIWQAREVRFFVRHHAPSHVLTVVAALTEEAEALPVVEIGGRERSLAADARGRSEREIRKKLKRDAALRLAAPILSMPYDGLVRRYRRYLRRKIGGTAVATLLLLSGFTGYALYQAWQRQLAQALAERNQAQNLCAAAMHQYESGDKRAALNTVLRSLGEVGEGEKAESYVVPEQVYALNKMLHSYASGHTSAFVLEEKLTEKFSEVAGIDGQNYLYGLDAQGRVEVVSAKTNAVVWTIDTEMLLKSLPDGKEYPSEAPSQMTLACPLEEGKVLVAADTLAAVADVETQTLEAAFFLAEPSASTPVYAAGGSRFAYKAISRKLYVYNYVTGEQEACISWDSGELGQSLSALSFSPDGTRLAFGTTEGLWVYDTARRKEKKITGASVCSVAFMECGNLAAVEYEEQPESPAQAGDFWQDEKSGYTPVLYDGTGVRLACGNTQNGYGRDEKGTASVKLERQGEEVEVWASWLRGDLRLADAESGLSIEEVSFHSDIVAVTSWEGHSLLVGLSDGSVRLLRMSGNVLIRRSAYPGGEELCGFFCAAGQEKLALHTENGIIFCRQAADGEMAQFDTEGFLYDVQYLPSEETGGYRALWFSDGLYKNAFTLYRKTDDTALCSYACREGWEIVDARLETAQGREWLLLLERSTADYKASKITKLAVSAPEETEEYDLSFVEEATGTNIWWGLGPMAYGPDLESFYVTDQKGELVRVSLTEKTAVPVFRGEEERILDVSLHKDGELLYILSAGQGQMKLYGYSLAEGKVAAEQVFACGQNMETIKGTITKNHGETMLAVYDQEHAVYLLDAGNLEILHTIETGKKEKLQLSFIRRDTCLLGADEEALWVYVPKEEKMAATYPTGPALGFGLKLSADWEGSYICLKAASVSENTVTDDGISAQPLHVFFLDEELQIYPFADIDYGYKLPDSPYVMSVYEDRFGYASGSLYDFSDLYKKAAASVR